MTQQAIADALGVSYGTVVNDLQFVNVDKLDDAPEQPDTVVGAYRARRFARSSAIGSTSSVGITPPGGPGRRRR